MKLTDIPVPQHVDPEIAKALRAVKILRDELEYELNQIKEEIGSGKDKETRA